MIEIARVFALDPRAEIGREKQLLPIVERDSLACHPGHHDRLAARTERTVRKPDLAADFGAEVQVLGPADLVEIGDFP